MCRLLTHTLTQQRTSKICSTCFPDCSMSLWLHLLHWPPQCCYCFPGHLICCVSHSTTMPSCQMSFLCPTDLHICCSSRCPIFTCAPPFCVPMLICCSSPFSPSTHTFSLFFFTAVFYFFHNSILL